MNITHETTELQNTTITNFTIKTSWNTINATIVTTADGEDVLIVDGRSTVLDEYDMRAEFITALPSLDDFEIDTFIGYFINLY
jgi:hypothetical protein